MKRKSPVKFCIVLVLTLLMSCFYMPVAQADSVSPFSDVKETHWAFKNVIKLQCRGVIAGYSDKTYKPDNVISQVEALILAVRNLAASNEVKAMDESQALPFAVPEWAANNNKQELLYALKLGLVKNDGSDFKATGAASRAWFTQLMIRMCAMTNEAANYAASKTDFKDDADITDDMRGIVNLAVKKGIISGYGDGTFMPNKYVTRVEAAALLDRCEKYLDISNSIKAATVQNVLGSMLTLQAGGGTQNALVADSTWCFDEKGKLIKTSDLKIGDNIKYVVGNTNIIYLEKTTETVAYVSSHTTTPPTVQTPVVTETPTESGVEGTVMYVSANDSLLVMRKLDGSLLTGSIVAGASIKDNTGAAIDLSSLPTDAKIKVSLKDNSFTSIVLQSSAANGSVIKQGAIYRIVPDQKLFMIKTSTGVETYPYTALLEVTVPDKMVATISDLNIGDNVRIGVEDGVMQSITLLSSNGGDLLMGEIVLMPTDTDMMIINVGGEKKIYTVANKVSVIIPGNLGASMSSLKVGDSIRFSLTNGAISKIEVENRLIGSDLEGRIKAIDTRENVLVLESAAGITYSYPIKERARILIDSEQGDLNDLEVGDEVSITLFNGEINTITALTGVNGVVTNVDASRMLLSIAESASGKNKTYAVAVSPDITIEGVSSPTLNSIHTGDTVRLSLEEDVAEKIEVERTIAYTVSGVKESSGRIIALSKGGASRTLYAKSTVELIMPGIAYPTIYDFKVGDQIDVTFLGSTLKKIEVIPIVLGQVMNVDSDGDSFSVRTFEGESKTFDLKQEATIITERTNGSNTESSSIKTLQVGDRVVVVADASNGMTVYRMDRVEGTFVTVLADTEQIRMIASPMIVNRTYGLYSEVYIHQGISNIGWGSFKVNDQIAVYLHESQVMEVEKL